MSAEAKAKISAAWAAKRRAGETRAKPKGKDVSQAVAIYVTKAYRTIKSMPIDEMDAAHLNIVLAYRELHRGSDV